MDGWQPDFREEQRFDQPWFYLLVGSMVLRELTRFAAKLRSDEGTRFRDWLRFLLLGVLVPSSLLRSRLITEAGSGHLRVRFLSPLRLEWEHTPDGRIDAEVVDYRPLRDYGGWGLRWSPFKGAAVTVSGTRGVKVRTPKGRSVLVGSQHPEALAAALDG